MWSVVSSHDVRPCARRSGSACAGASSACPWRRPLRWRVAVAASAPSWRGAGRVRGGRWRCAGRLRPSDLMYSISCSSCSSLTRPWKVGMIGWKPGDDLRAGVQDRLAEVGLVRRHHLAARRAPTGLPKSPSSTGPRPCASARWQRDARRGPVNSFCPAAAIDRLAAPPPSHAWYSAGSMHDDPADHPGVLGAAVLRAEQVVRARLGRLEPQRGVAARAARPPSRGTPGRRRSGSRPRRSSSAGPARPTGTCSSLISRCPSRCWNFHIHCLPTT